MEEKYAEIIFFLIIIRDWIPYYPSPCPTHGWYITLKTLQHLNGVLLKTKKGR